MSSGPVTTDAILDAAEDRTGLLRAQLLVLVAKSATVRHLATHPKYKELFVCSRAARCCRTCIAARANP